MSEPSSNPSLHVELVITDASWSDIADDLAGLVSRAARGAFAMAGAADLSSGVVDVTLADDETLRGLNAEWRGKDKPTNVLSFPSGDPQSPDGPVFLGDIILARETVVAEAQAQGKRVDSHLTHLVVHGMLHLLGLDHETAEDAEHMESLERKILLGFGIGDPYLIVETGPEPKP